MDSIKLIDSGVEVRIILTGLEYTDELLEKIEQDSANDPFRDGSTDNDFFNKNSLKGHFVITLNENGETFLQVTNQSWMAVPGKVAVKVSRR